MIDTLNFAYLLLISIFFLSVLSFLSFNFDILQPNFIFLITMFFSNFLTILNIDEWGLYIGPNTFLIVFLGLLAFGIGSIYSHYVILNKGQNTIKQTDLSTEYMEIEFDFIKFALLSLVILSILIHNFFSLYELSLQVGNSGGIGNMINSLRFPLERGEIEFPRAVRLGSAVALSISTICMYWFINISFKYKHKLLKNKIKLASILLPIILTLPILILSTGRREIVHFIIAFTVMYAILYYRNYGDTQINRLKVIKILLGAFIVSVVAYLSLGVLTNKINSSSNIFRVISHYGGLSLPALEKALAEPVLENLYFGQNTLLGIYGNLNSLGFDLERGKAFLSFVEFSGMSAINTNVYTVFYRQILDYSILGMLILMFIWGMICTFSYGYLKKSKNILWLIVYVHFSFVPFFLFIDDQFMLILTSETIYFVIISWIVIKFLNFKIK